MRRAATYLLLSFAGAAAGSAGSLARGALDLWAVLACAALAPLCAVLLSGASRPPILPGAVTAFASIALSMLAPGPALVALVFATSALLFVRDGETQPLGQAGGVPLLAAALWVNAPIGLAGFISFCLLHGGSRPLKTRLSRESFPQMVALLLLAGLILLIPARFLPLPMPIRVTFILVGLLGNLFLARAVHNVHLSRAGKGAMALLAAVLPAIGLLVLLGVARRVPSLQETASVLRAIGLVLVGGLVLGITLLSAGVTLSRRNRRGVLLAASCLGVLAGTLVSINALLFLVVPWAAATSETLGRWRKVGH